MNDPKKDRSAASDSLLGHMYDNPSQKYRCLNSCFGGIRGHKRLVRWMSKVSEVRGNNVILERPLPVDVRLKWKPVLHSVPSDFVVQNSGIEGLTVEFRSRRSKEHLQEDGHNAILIEEAAFSWVYDVSVLNADVNFLARYSNFISFTRIKANVTEDRSNRKSKGKQGHIAVGIHDSCDVHVSDFEINAKYWHDLSVRASMLSVFRNGSGYDISMDLHRTAPYMILYSDIFLGKGTDPFTKGGKQNWGMPSAAYTTFWNISKEGYEPIKVPDCDYGPKLNFFGNFKGRECKGHVLDKEKDISPPDIYEYQVKKKASASASA